MGEPKVHLGAARVELYLPGIRSLKGKRGLVRPIEAAWRDQLGASVAEVGWQDSHQRACLGVSVAGSSATAVDRVLERVRPMAERDPRVVVVRCQTIVDTLDVDDEDDLGSLGRLAVGTSGATSRWTASPSTTGGHVLHPRLLELGDEPVEETDDAIDDHDDITEAVERSRDLEPGSSDWWDAVDEARDENSEHTAEEERGALADFRRNATPELREEVGGAWVRFHQEHTAVDRDTRDVVDDVDTHGSQEQVQQAREIADD